MGAEPSDWREEPHPLSAWPHGYGDALAHHLVTDHEQHTYQLGLELPMLVAEHDRLHGHVREWPPPGREPAEELLEATEELLRALPRYLSGDAQRAARRVRTLLEHHRMGLTP